MQQGRQQLKPADPPVFQTGSAERGIIVSQISRQELAQTQIIAVLQQTGRHCRSRARFHKTALQIGIAEHGQHVQITARRESATIQTTAE